MAATEVNDMETSQTETKFKPIDPIRNKFMTYLFLHITCQSFFANIIFMIVRFSVSEGASWPFYLGVLLFMIGLAVSIALLIDEQLRNEYPKNLFCIIAFTFVMSVAFSFFEVNSSSENVWAICYLTLFLYLFIYVIGSSGFIDLSNTIHLHLLSIAIMMILTGVFMVFSFIMDVAIHPITLSIAFLILSAATSYIIFESINLLEKNRINPTMITIPELTKTIAHIYANLIYRAVKLVGIPLKEPV